MNLVIVGSVALDDVKTNYGSVERALGGSAIYASMAAKNFCKTAIVGVAGSDFPKEHIELLKANDICTKGLEFLEGKTFVWKGIYDDPNLAETLDTQLNVFADFDPQLPEDYRDSKFVFLGNIHPELQLNVLDQMNEPIVTACDTMNFWIESCKDKLLKVINRVDILFINEDEIKMLTGEKNIYKAADIVKQMGPKLIIVKRGEFGAVAFHEDFTFFSPAFPIRDVVDTTGAGDSFAGGFMGYLVSQGKLTEDNVRKAMILGTVMASFDVEDFSLERLKNLDNNKIYERYDKIHKSVLF